MPADNLNFRDIGGLAAGGGRTRSGVLYRSEGPRNFAPGQLAALRGLGIRSIIDLRSALEREEAPHDWQGPDCRWLGFDVDADLRVFGNDGRERLRIGPEPEIAISTMAETYREIVGALLPHWPAIADALLGRGVPVLLNCTAGKDRTGVAIALLLELAGVSRDAIVRDYMRSTVFSDNLKRSDDLEAGLLSTFGFMPSAGQVDALIGVREDYLEAAWDELARKWTDVRGYFLAAGLDGAVQRRIGALLVD
ncbi:MAG: tyrosine-protein phosphatase [Sphingomonadales bacterium]|nr:tyrosine-protein phosphatase [Sphingomonadales bacterium]MDE2569481.1 tyrosine-protein phosphatase [Sphingomonadales bacterium]